MGFRGGERKQVVDDPFDRNVHPEPPYATRMGSRHCGQFGAAVLKSGSTHVRQKLWPHGSVTGTESSPARPRWMLHRSSL